MKIVQINTFPYKATGAIMLNIHKQLKEEAIQSYVVWGRGREPQTEEEISIEDKWGMRFHGAYTRVTDQTGFASWRATKKLIKKLQEIQPDIVHLHNIHGYYIHIDILFSYLKASGCKVVWTLHDCWSFTGHCAYFDMIQCEKWKTGCFQCPQKHTYPASKFLDRSKWNYAHKKKAFCGADITIVTPCKWLADVVRESYLKEYPVEVIYNGVDFDSFRPIEAEEKIRKQYDIKDRCLILGVASEWTERKGMQDFIRLSQQLDAEKYRIMMIGLTKEQIRLIEEQDTKGNMIALERTENLETLVASYSAADIFWNPTYEDNFPTTNLEALACTTPVCTYSTGGSIESVTEETGCILKKGDVQGFLNWLTARYENGYPRKLGIHIDRAAMKDKFSKETMIRQYIELYKKIDK